MHRSHRLLVAAALAVVAAFAVTAPAPGAGVVPKAGSLFGGGWIGSTYAPSSHPNLTLVNIRVARSGGTATVYLDLVAGCGGTYSTFKIPVTVKNVPVANGSFAVSGQMRDQDANAAGRYDISGRFVSPMSAVGTASETFSYKQGTTVEGCQTPTIHWGARADTSMSSAAGKPVVRRGGLYYGNTSQQLDFVLKVSGDGKRVATAAALVNAHCAKDPAGYYVYVDPVAPPSTTISAKGNFASTEQYKLTLTTHDGVAATGIASAQLIGRFGASSVAGTWDVLVDVRDASTGQHLDSCASGVVRFKADL